MPTDNRAKGIDVSYWQQNIDWRQVRAADVAFAVSRASVGLFTDSTFNTNWQAMKAEMILRGAYHYFLFSVNSIQQAQLFANNLSLEAGDLPPILDVEVNSSEDDHAELDFLHALSGDERIRRVKDCLDEIERLTSQKPMIYTSSGFWNEFMNDSAGQPPTWSSQYELWIATWGDEATLPHGWSQWRIWQYTNVGSVAGVVSSVDRDYFNGTAAEMRAWLGAPDTSVIVPIPIPTSSFKHQLMINAFAKVFGAQFFWSKIESAGLAYLATDRQAAYQGPSVYDLPNLTEQEKNVLVAILTEMGVDVSAWKAAQVKTALLPTNQAMINTFETVFGASYWDKVVAANLTSMATDRYAEYAGPAVHALPTLSDQDKEQLIASLKKQGFNASLWQKPAVAASPSITNQAMIDAFHQTFGENTYWNKITAAGLESLAVSSEARQAAYSGQAIDDLPGLSKTEKESLTATFAKWGIDVSIWKKSPPKTRPDVTNQQLINLFSEVFGEAFWSKVEAASLGWVAKDRATRNAVYSGPAIEDLPTLTDDEKKAIIDELNKKPSTKTNYVWKHHALPGLHGPGDPGGGWVPEAYAVVRQTKVRAVKMFAPDLQPDEVIRLRQINPDMFIMARLFSAQLGERRPQGFANPTPEDTARWFINEVADRGDGNNPMNRAYHAASIEYFEVHNEPNLRYEGVGVNWHDGAEFARFFNTTVDILKQDYPKAKFGFPGLSPGSVDGGRPIDMWTFLDQAQAALDRADFLCCHFYWGGDGTGYEVAINDLRKFCERYPHKLVFCSEFSNSSPYESPERKADQYAAFYNACKDLPSNLGGMFAYALSWGRDEGNEGFLRWEHGWKPTPMASRLGNYSF